MMEDIKEGKDGVSFVLVFKLSRFGRNAADVLSTLQIMAWDYDVTDASGRAVAHLSKELFHLTDTYVLEIAEAQDALLVLMIALAIDAANCSSQGG